MQPYKQVSCNSKYELLCEEQKVINDLKPNMNERNAIKQVKSRDEKIAYNRAWYQRKKAERYCVNFVDITEKRIKKEIKSDFEEKKWWKKIENE